MKTRSSPGPVTTFAHLLGLGGGAKRAADDDTDKKTAEDDEETESGAEDDGEDDDEGGDDDQKDDKPKEKGRKKAKKRAEDEAGSEDDGDDDDGEEAVRRSERARCGRIIAAGIKAGCVEQAGILAFDSDMPSKQAVAVLRAGIAAAGSAQGGLYGAMAAARIPNPGSGAPAAGDPSDPKAIAARIIEAGKRRRGEA